MEVLGTIILVIAIVNGTYWLLKYFMVPNVAAGRSENHCRFSVSNSYANVIDKNGNNISIINLQRMKVAGNSMSKFGINNGDLIFVSKYSNVDDSSIIVFKVKEDFYKSQYKLRKVLHTFLVEDVNHIDIRRLFDGCNNVDIDYTVFSSDIQKRIDELKKSNKLINGQYVVTTSMNTDKSFHYSMHHVNTIYGQAKYCKHC